MSADLVAYLRAREDEREQAQMRRRRIRADAPSWTAETCGDGRHFLDGIEVTLEQFEDFYAEFSDPAPDPLVLADIAAKRAILDRLELVRTEDSAGWNEYSEWIQGRRGPELARTTDPKERAGLEMAARLMAQMHADRDDFPPEWRLS